MSKNNTIWDEGYNAGWDGKINLENPYPDNSEEAKTWERGRFTGRDDKSEKE